MERGQYQNPGTGPFSLKRDQARFEKGPWQHIMGLMAEPRVVKFHRHRHAQRAVLYDEQLDLRSLEEWRDWATGGIDFVIIDSESGEDVTRVLLA
jgi:hypothetical protein